MLDDSMGSELVKSQNPNGATSNAPGNGHLGKSMDDKSRTADMGDACLSDIGAQANLVLNLINELKSITDRAVNLAVSEAEFADRIEESKKTEVIALRAQLKETNDSLHARDAALRELEEISQSKMGELENRLREKDTLLENRDNESKRLQLEIGRLTNRLNQAEIAAKKAESQSQRVAERLEEIAAVKRQLEEREECLRQKDSALKDAEAALKANTQDLEIQLQKTEAKLHSQETELKKKENLIRQAATNEADIGKLIQRLSSECEKLSRELSTKSLAIAQLEKKERRSFSESWQKVLGLIQQ